MDYDKISLLLLETAAIADLLSAVGTDDLAKDTIRTLGEVIFRNINEIQKEMKNNGL